MNKQSKVEPAEEVVVEDAPKSARKARRWIIMLGIPALAGSLIIGAPGTAIALWVGLVIADGVLLRKGLQIACINAGREVVALIAAIGLELAEDLAEIDAVG